jgi:hypothetical protein
MYIKYRTTTGQAVTRTLTLHYMPLVTEHISRSPVTDYASSFSNTLPITEPISSYSPHQQLHYSDRTHSQVDRKVYCKASQLQHTPPVTVHILVTENIQVDRNASSYKNTYTKGLLVIVNTSSYV